MSQINPEQVEVLENYKKTWLKKLCCTKLSNRPKTEELINQLYSFQNLEAPKYFYVDSPLEANGFINHINEAEIKGKELDYEKLQIEAKEEVQKILKGGKAKSKEYNYSSCGCSLDANWSSFYKYLKDEQSVVFDAERIKNFDIIYELASHSFSFYMYEGVCIVCERPAEVNHDGGPLNNHLAPVIKFRDGFGIYFVNNIRIPGWIIESPEKITSEKIDKEKNAEIKRIMIKKMGEGNYIEQSNAKLIHEDEFGQLYKKEFKQTDKGKLEDLYSVRVIDSVIDEQTGKPKIHWLGVPPTAVGVDDKPMVHAKQAVAWTYGLTEEAYNPEVRT